MAHRVQLDKLASSEIMMIRQLENATADWQLFISQRALADREGQKLGRWTKKTKGAITRVQSRACGPQSGRMGKHVPKYIKQGFKRAKQQLVAK